MAKSPLRYLIIPGWQGSSAAHWQSYWQRKLPNAHRVEQQDWFEPELAAWTAQLDQSIAASTQPTILIAHSLGCITVAHWAKTAARGLRQQVLGALLVAPADVERPFCPDALRGFAPIPRQPLPFSSLMLASTNDPAATAERATELAQDWGSAIEVLPQVGHINVASGHRQWSEGFAYLYRLQCQIERQSRLSA